MNNPDGIRMSTALTYLNPVRHRLNLTVKAQVLVRRLLFRANRSLAWNGQRWRALYRRGGGGHPDRRGHRLAATADALGCGAGGASAQPGNPGRACLTRGRLTSGLPLERRVIEPE